VRIYSASDEEALRARGLLKDWAGEGFLTEPQYQRMEQDTVCELRTTNIFLRLVLFLFTLLIAGAAVGLFFAVSGPSQQTTGAFLLIFATVSYAAAEVAVAQYRLYRYGIEEALAICAVGLLCLGIAMAFSGTGQSEVLVPSAGAIFSLWIWRRFGLPYAFLAAMVFVVFLPAHWISSPAAQHLIVAAFYATALAIVTAVRSRHRLDNLNEGYSLVEALLWLGIYLAINLRLSLVKPLEWVFGIRTSMEFSKPLYWATWVLIWLLPPIVLVRGLRQRDRFVIIVGMIATILTLVTNKPYLGWKWHTWDPMLLGALLIGVAVLIRRWLTNGPGGIRHGFTAERLSGKDKRWMSAGSAALGVLSPEAITPAPQTTTPAVRFSGGDSGGGGATSEF
jgi:hypothetical protein